MVIYLYKATIYHEDSRSTQTYQGMTIAEDYNTALCQIQDYYTGADEYLYNIYLEEQNECECNCFELNNELFNFIHKHGDLPHGWDEKDED